MLAGGEHAWSSANTCGAALLGTITCAAWLKPSDTCACCKGAGNHALVQAKAPEQCAHLYMAWLQVSHTSEELLAMKKYINKSQTEADRLRDEIAHNKVGWGLQP